VSDDKATIDRQAAQIAMLREALEAFDKSAKESASIIGFAGKALKLLQQARAALTATAADVEAWEKQRRDAVLEEIAAAFEAMGSGCEMFAQTAAQHVLDMKDTKP
jgi:hypothetical protein